jgi:hypothetical protein
MANSLTSKTVASLAARSARLAGDDNRDYFEQASCTLSSIAEMPLSE